MGIRLLEMHAPDRIDRDVYLVNPGRDHVFTHKCYRSLDDLPEEIDMVIIATPKRTVEDVLRQAAAKGARAAVVYAAGYGETGKPEDKALEQRLIALCRELDMAVMGPNCAGFINVLESLPAMGFMTTIPKKAGHVGLVSQSGMICTLLLDSKKADFSYVISSGNSKIVEVVDYIDFLIDDPQTDVIASYIEGVSNPGKFISVLKKAAKKGKPVILLKIGRSEKGSRSAASHTGSLSGSDAVFDAVFEKYGVIRVDDLEDLSSMANLMATLPRLPAGDRVVSLNGSGGENGVACDVGSGCGLNYPDFSPDHAAKLRTLLDDFATINNPLDTTADICYDADKFADAAEVIINDPNFDIAVVGNSIVEELTDLCVKYMTEGLIKLVKEGRVTKPIVMMPAIESGRMPDYINALKEVGIPVTSPCSYGYRQIAKLLKYVNWKARTDVDALEDAVPDPTLPGEKTALSEHASKELLAGCGIPVPTEIVAVSEEEAVRAAEKIGFPVVMKIESADILHKTDAGGVVLNVTDTESVRRAYRQILDNCARSCPEARINGVLVQQMLQTGAEIIVGVTNDMAFGPMVLCGMGGVFTEVFKDAALYPAPLTKADAERMIRSLKACRLLDGYRGGPKLDIDALAELLVRVGRFAADRKDTLVEMDLNPVFVYPEGQGAAAADALVVLKK